MQLSKDFIMFCRHFANDLIREKGLLKTLEKYSDCETENALGDHYDFASDDFNIDFNIMHTGDFSAQAYGYIERNGALKSVNQYQIWIDNKQPSSHKKWKNKIYVQLDNELGSEEAEFDGVDMMSECRPLNATITRYAKEIYTAHSSNRTKTQPLGLTQFKLDQKQTVNREMNVTTEDEQQ